MACAIIGAPIIITTAGFKMTGGDIIIVRLAAGITIIGIINIPGDIGGRCPLGIL